MSEVMWKDDGGLDGGFQGMKKKKKKKMGAIRDECVSWTKNCVDSVCVSHQIEFLFVDLVVFF